MHCLGASRASIIVTIVYVLCVAGFVNRLLSWKALVPLSRLTYMAYLIHAYVMMSYFFQQKYPFNYDTYSMVSRTHTCRCICMYIYAVAIQLTHFGIYNQCPKWR